MLNKVLWTTVLAISTTPAFVGGSNQGNEPKKGEPEPQALMKLMEGFRKKLPPPQGIGEENGKGREDEKGEPYLYSHLRGVALRMEVKSKTNCMILLTYLKDPSVKLRLIAGFALDNVVKIYPDGFTAPDFENVDTDEHRSMVQAFVAKIAKLET